MVSTASHGTAIDAVVESLRSSLQPAAIVLYGSAARGELRSTSDIDLAVLLGRPAPAWAEANVLRLELAEVAGCDVDLVFLDEASPILAMEVLRSGTVVDCANGEAFEAFAVRIFTDYADLKITRRPIEERLLRASTHDP